MKKEIIIRLPLIKRWILRLFIGGILNDLEKSRLFYEDGAKVRRNFGDLKAHDMYLNQGKGVKQAIGIIKEHLS